MEKKIASIFLAALLLAVVFQMGSMVRYYSVIANEETVLSAWAGKPPKIDGTIEGEEWSTAAKIDFNITNYNGTIYVMNDGGNLYLAANITDDDFGTEFNTYDVFMFFFDNDNDGVPEKGDDGLFCWSITGPPYDVFYNVTEPNAWLSDEADSGTVDGYHDETSDSGYNYFECVHPLDSSDDVHDFSLKIGDIVGFRVSYRDNASAPIGFWPDAGWCYVKIAYGDLVLSDNDIYTVAGNYYMNGSIIVTENATLVIENAQLTFMQTAHSQFNITLRDAAGGNPRLIVNNTVIGTNTYNFIIGLYENGTAQINSMQPAPNSPIFLLLSDSSSANISESTFTEVSLYNQVSLHLASSYVGLLRAVDESYTSASHATIYYLHAANSAEVQVSDNATIYTLGVQSSKTQCNIQGMKPVLTAYWNFLENCSVVIGSGGFAPNLTLRNVRVNGWSFSFVDAVDTIVSDSHLYSLSASGFSAVQAHRVYIESVSVSDYSRVNATDSIAGKVFLAGSSVLWVENSTASEMYIYGQSVLYVNWYLSVHVVDSVGQDVPDANVTVVCFDGTETARGKTNMTGWVKLTVLSSIINATGELLQGPHNVTATYETYSNTTTINVNGNKQATVVLSEFIIPEFPASFPMIPVLVAAASAATLLCKSKNARKKR